LGPNDEESRIAARDARCEPLTFDENALLDDAVDEVIETVLAKGGRVVFVDDGTLGAHSRIALILRY